MSPNKCSCDSGWTGNACDKAICEMPCTSHGNCTAPNTCSCEDGWQGMTCEMPFAPGFTPSMSYVYNVSISYTMECDIMMNTDSSIPNGLDIQNFLSNVNITFSVSTIQIKSNSSISMLKILNATCFSDFGKQIKETCNQESAYNLLQTKVMFSQNLKTGKIENIYYNSSTEVEANLIARLLRFIDCKTAPSTEKTEEVSTVNGRQLILLRHRSKSQSGMQCFNFKRMIKDKEMVVTDQEEKKVCMGESGAPEIITMSEAFNIGKDMKLEKSLANEDEMNASPLPSFKGRVTAVGYLHSMGRMTDDDIEEELKNVYIASTADNMFSTVDEFALKDVSTHEEYKDSNILSDIERILRHPSPDRRLSLGLDLVKKSKSVISVIRKMLFSNSIPDTESRSLLVAILGSSQTTAGQKTLLQMLDANERVKGDHYLALGSVAQLANPTDDIVSVISRFLMHSKDTDVKIRSALVLGVLGSKGFQHRVVPILTNALLNNDVPHEEKCSLISALGNTHSENAHQTLSKFVNGKETLYEILSVRALKNIPGRKSYQLVLDTLLQTRNKKMVIQCLKTLEYKGKWISTNDSNSIQHIAHETKDIDILSAMRIMFLQLNEKCTGEQKQDFQAKAMQINKIIVELKSFDMKTFEVKQETQNFGVYFQMSVDSQIRGSEFDFNADANLDVKVFGRRVNVLTAGSANGLVDTDMFMSSVFMTLKLFGREFDLFMKSWKFELNLGLAAGNPCLAKNGVIRHTLSEHFKFDEYDFKYGIFNFASVTLKVGLSGRVSFGYGFNIIGNDGDMLPQQLNVIARPEANATVTLDTNVNAPLVKVGVRGELSVISGNVQTNIAVNLQNRTFCHFIDVDAHFLKGSLYITGHVGFSFFKRNFNVKIFSWRGRKISKTISESYCCPDAFQLSTSRTSIQSYDTFYSLTNSSMESYQRKMSDALSVLNSINTCSNTVKRNRCPVRLVRDLLRRRLHVFDLMMLRKLMSENHFLSIRHIKPLLVTITGDLYGVNKIGDVVHISEYGLVTKVRLSFANLLANLAYTPEIGYTPVQMADERALHQHPGRSLIQSTNKVLDFRPYCSRMMAVCENIKMGKMYHGETMVFTENKKLEAINDKEACSAYVKSNGVRFPLYCEAYPFSFTLQGGAGATVMSVNQMERNVKMEAMNAFIRSSNLKGGDSFIVLV